VLEEYERMRQDHQRSLAESLRVANARLDENVRELALAKASQDRALLRRERAMEALKKTNLDLDQFAHVASHDLKAPLRGIANISDWLEEDLGAAMTPASKEHLRLLRSRIYRMEALIDGILAYAKAGRERSASKRVDIAPLVEGVVELLAPPKGTVRVTMEDGLKAVDAEDVPLQQVFMNLIGNALKHAGGPNARVIVLGKETEEGWEFSVTDNGPGIDPRYHERIFRIFHTLASRDQVEGTGIGLATVKKLVESRGGRVSVESAPGAGATFRFLWPRPEASDPSVEE
jgi:signal transduction histidine kinase